MRASFILLGPLLSRFGRVIISNPGGDRIGRRPVNLHVDAMRALGAEIEYRNGYYFARSPGRLRGDELTFPFVSVMGTENAILAAVLADGHTIIRPAAAGARGRRPDRVPADDGRGDRADLPRTRSRSRAAIACAAPTTGSSRTGSRPGTFVVAAAVTGGQVTLECAPCDHLGAFLEALERSGSTSAAARHDRGLGRGPRPVPGDRHDHRPVSRPGHRPPAADLRPADPGRRRQRTSTRRSSRTASSSWAASPGWAPGSGSRTPTMPRSPDRPAPRRRDRDR